MSREQPGRRRPVLYFVRHGETAWNAEKRLQGQLDIPLNALGRVQATHCGDVLRGLFERHGRKPASLDYVSSPLKRASETMERLRSELGLPPQDYRTDARLMEMSFGAWEGFTYADVRRDGSDILATRERDKWRFKPPQGESYEELTARVSAWYESVKQDTVVTAHGGVARSLMAYLKIADFDTATHGDIAQGTVYVFDGAEMTRHS
jgi:probable phosphoglycerate mutase